VSIFRSLTVIVFLYNILIFDLRIIDLIQFESFGGYFCIKTNKSNPDVVSFYNIKSLGSTYINKEF